VLPSVKRLGPAVWITIGVFALALAAGYLVGLSPQWRIQFPQDTSMTEAAKMIGRYTNVPTQTGALLLIVWQNGRILLAALILALFTFGAAALVLTPAVYFILGYLFSQIILNGLNPGFMFTAIFTHGIVEIPMIVLATAAALRLGAVVTRLPRGLTVGQAWTAAFADTIKLAVGLVIPGLLLAAFIEAFITPRLVVAILGG
jgi:uncharacterized membrane protein SpoIIM required for sporulation